MLMGLNGGVVGAGKITRNGGINGGTAGSRNLLLTRGGVHKLGVK